MSRIDHARRTYSHQTTIRRVPTFDDGPDRWRADCSCGRPATQARYTYEQAQRDARRHKLTEQCHAFARHRADVEAMARRVADHADARRPTRAHRLARAARLDDPQEWTELERRAELRP